MKKTFAFIMIILVCLSVISGSFASSKYWRFSTFGDSSETKGLFDGDTFSLDLFMCPEELTAYIQISIWKGHDVTTMTKFAKVQSKTSVPKTLFFVFADDSYYTAHYDEKGTYLIWLDIDGYSIRLEDVDEFVAGFALKGY